MMAPALCQAGCLEESPKPNERISATCSELGTNALYRGSYSYIPYELAPDGLWKEHHPPIGERSALLDFTKAHTGKLLRLATKELPKYCAYYYHGVHYDTKNGKENMEFIFKRSKMNGYDQALLDQVMKGDNHLSVNDLAAISSELAAGACELGEQIFKNQLVSHAGALDADYRGEYLRKMRLVIASLNKAPKEFQASDCDYLNAPINQLYGLVQISRLTAQMVKNSCPAEYNDLKLESEQKELSSKVDREWKRAANQAVNGGEAENDPSPTDNGSAQ
jgi:hypothetical protein